jgi:hypothetical protein
VFRDLAVDGFAMGENFSESFFLLYEHILLASDVLFVGEDESLMLDHVELLLGDALDDFVVFRRETS